MLQLTRNSHEKRVLPGVLACAIAAFVFVAAFLSGCQPIQPAETIPETGDFVMAAEPVASPALRDEAGADSASGEEAVADSATAEEGARDEAVQPDAALVEAGMAVYRAQYCGICHTFTEAGTTGTFGPPHDEMAVTAALRLQDARYIGPAKNAEEYLYESIVKPEVYTVEGYVGTSHAMPPYAHLAEEDLWALVALLMAGE